MTRNNKTVAALIFATDHNGELNVCFIRENNKIQIRRVSLYSNVAKMFDKLHMGGEDRIRWESYGEVARYAELNGVPMPTHPVRCRVSKETWNRVPEVYYKATMRLYGKSPSVEDIRQYAESLVLAKSDKEVIVSACWKDSMEELTDPGNIWTLDGKWVRCTSRQWREALECLPPTVWTGHVFAMGEAAAHNKNGAVYHIFYRNPKTDECFTRRDNLRYFDPIRYKAEIAAAFDGGEPPVQPPGQADVYSDMFAMEFAMELAA